MENICYYAQNDLIGLEPFKTNALEKTGIQAAFAVAKQSVELTPLKVVFGTREYERGATVYVRGNLCTEEAAKHVYEIDGQRVIFIKTSEIKLYKRVVTWDYTSVPMDAPRG